MADCFENIVFLVPPQPLDKVVGCVDAELRASRLELEPSEKPFPGSQSTDVVARGVAAGYKSDLAFLVYSLPSRLVRVSFRGESGSTRVQAIMLEVSDSVVYERDSVAHCRILVRAARRIHRALHATRTIWKRHSDATVDWQTEWARLARGVVEGDFWLDILDTTLATDEREKALHDAWPQRYKLKRFSWGLYFQRSQLPR